MQQRKRNEKKHYKLTELKNTLPPPCAPCVREIYIVTVFKEALTHSLRSISRHHQKKQKKNKKKKKKKREKHSSYILLTTRIRRLSLKKRVKNSRKLARLLETTIYSQCGFYRVAFMSCKGDFSALKTSMCSLGVFFC